MLFSEIMMVLFTEIENVVGGVLEMGKEGRKMLISVSDKLSLRRQWDTQEEKFCRRLTTPG